MMPEKLQAARLKLVKERPYLAAALWAAVPVERPGLGTLTMDQWWRLYYDPAVAAWPVDSLAGILYHALCHLLRSHPERLAGCEQVVANLACFPAGTWLADGSDVSAMPIRVIGPSGWQPAIPMRRRVRGRLIRLTALGLRIAATPEHPLLVYRRLGQDDRTPSQRKALPDPQWLPAHDVRPGDYLVIPRLPGSVSLRSIPLDRFMLGGDSGWGRTVLHRGFPLTTKTAWLLGLYTAKGSGLGYPQLALGRREEQLARRAVAIAQELGFRGKADVGSNGRTLRVRFGGPVLARALKAWCGDGARQKRIPDFVLLHEDLSILYAFLKGLVDGDGHRRREDTSHKGYVSISASSPALATQVPLALARLGTGCHLRTECLPPRRLGDVLLPPRLLYTVSWKAGGPTVTTRWLNGGESCSVATRWKYVPEGIAIPVTEVSLEPFEGDVFNFSTSDHQYIVNSVLVHNCDAEINDDLRGEKVSLPEGAVYPEMFDPPLPAGGLAEEYYAELLRRRQHKQGPAFQGSGEAGRSGQGAGESEAGAGRDGTDAGARQGVGSGAAAGGSAPTAGESMPGAGGSSGASQSGEADGSSSVSPGRTSNLSRPSGHPVQPLTGSSRSQGGEGNASGADGTRTPRPGAGRCGSCATGQTEPWEEPPPDESETPGMLAAQAELIRRQVAQEILRIAQAARDRGEIPGHWRRWAEEKLSPRVDWRRELASAVRQAVSSAQGAADYTYRRPSRRQAAYGQVVMPSLYSPIPEVAVVVDTSGSMSDQQVSQALAEVAGILRGLGNRTAVHVLAVDAAVQACRRVFRPEQVELAGGGGTDMRVGLEAALKLRPRPEVVVVITDGHSPWPERPPGQARVIVVLVGDGESPGWTRTIKVEV